jgi:hypothetical protein
MIIIDTHFLLVFAALYLLISYLPPGTARVMEIEEEDPLQYQCYYSRHCVTVK